MNAGGLTPGLRRLVGHDVARTWETLAPVLSDELYLAGDTGLAAHLEHRPSRDLDFLFHRGAIDLDGLAARLGELGDFEVTQRSPGTLEGVFGATPVQVLHADEVRPQRQLEPTCGSPACASRASRTCWPPSWLRSQVEASYATTTT